MNLRKHPAAGLSPALEYDADGNQCAGGGPRLAGSLSQGVIDYLVRNRPDALLAAGLTPFRNLDGTWALVRAEDFDFGIAAANAVENARTYYAFVTGAAKVNAAQGWEEPGRHVDSCLNCVERDTSAAIGRQVAATLAAIATAAYGWYSRWQSYKVDLVRGVGEPSFDLLFQDGRVIGATGSIKSLEGPTPPSTSRDASTPWTPPYPTWPNPLPPYPPPPPFGPRRP